MKVPNPNQEPSASSKAPNQDLKDMDVLCTFKISLEEKNCIRGLSNFKNHIKIMIKMPNFNPDPSASTNAVNLDLKEIDALCPFQINLVSQKQNRDLSNLRSHIKVMIKMQNPNEEPPASSKA